MSNNKFGMFIHWGLYAQTELQEQAIARYNIPREEYEALINSFDPVNYDPEAWVLLAKKCGMQYICFTTKHHDGFCMRDTKYTDYNIMNTPYGKDVLKLLADACKKHDMKLSLYYSNPDWHHYYGYNPKSTHQWQVVQRDEVNTEAYREYLKNQVTELLTNYGPIYTFFWDNPPCYEDRSMNEFVRSLQPSILINDRGWGEKGDFSTPEREVPEGNRFESMTEACQAVGEQSWGYRTDEDYYSVSFLKRSVCKIMAMGGSYLLNVGPMPSGKIDPVSADIIRKVGDWYCRMEGCLEDSRPDPVPFLNARRNEPLIKLRKNGKTYFVYYNGLDSSAVNLEYYPAWPKKVRLLNNGQELEMKKTYLPNYFAPDGTSCGPHISLRGIPVDEFDSEPIVLELEW